MISFAWATEPVNSGPFPDVPVASGVRVPDEAPARSWAVLGAFFRLVTCATIASSSSVAGSRVIWGPPARALWRHGDGRTQRRHASPAPDTRRPRTGPSRRQAGAGGSHRWPSPAIQSQASAVGL